LAIEWPKWYSQKLLLTRDAKLGAIMNALEFTTELTNSATLKIPVDIASQLPKAGKVRVIVLTEESADEEWRLGAYEQFLRDDSEEDAIYESLR
jgi:hypothetical protein